MDPLFKGSAVCNWSNIFKYIKKNIYSFITIIILFKYEIKKKKKGKNLHSQYDQGTIVLNDPYQGRCPRNPIRWFDCPCCVLFYWERLKILFVLLLFLFSKQWSLVILIRRSFNSNNWNQKPCDNDDWFVAP